MAIVIPPKNIYEKSVERKNDNLIQNPTFNYTSVEYSYVDVYSESIEFYKEQNESSKYYYDINADELQSNGFTIVYYYNPTGSSNYYDFAYKKVTFPLKDRLLDPAFLTNTRDNIKRTFTGTKTTKSTEITQIPDINITSFDNAYYLARGDLFVVQEDEIVDTIYSCVPIESNTDAGGGLIIDSTNTNETSIVFYIVYTLCKYTQTNSGEESNPIKTNLTYILTSSYEFSVLLYESGVNMIGSSGDFAMESNELYQASTIRRYAPSNRTDNRIQIHKEFVQEIELDGVLYKQYRIYPYRQYSHTSEIHIKLNYYDGSLSTPKYSLPYTIHSGDTEPTLSVLMVYYFLNTDPRVEVVSISPEYDSRYYYTIMKKEQAGFLAEKIVENYNEGKQTAVLECSIDDYYNESGTKVISKNASGGLPAIFKNNDIVYPKRVVMEDVGGEYAQKEVDLSEGRRYRVVGVKIKYDGSVSQELTLLEEKTQ